MCPPQRRKLPVERASHRLGQFHRRGEQNRRGVLIVLGLRQQVRSEPRGISVVGDDEHFGRPRDEINRRVPRHQTLGRRNVSIAGADNFGDGRNGLGPVGERRDRLRAADRVDFLNSQLGGNCENFWNRPRRRDHDALDPGHLRRDRRRQERGGQRVAASGDVAADACKRAHKLPKPNAPLRRFLPFLGHLHFRKAADISGRDAHGGPELCRNQLSRRCNLARRDGEFACVLAPETIPAPGVAHQRSIAFQAHGPEDRRHGPLGFFQALLAAREDSPDLSLVSARYDSDGQITHRLIPK